MGGILNGIGVSPGIARGAAFVLTCGERAVAARRSIAAEDVAREHRRFEAAVSAATAQLAALQQEVSRAGPTQVDVLGAQALMLRDAGLRDRVLLLVE
ncbi:MAG: phosphoenolpyruvate-utilizing N-terminal domain-containing protein, partial [Anaeromyxobacteraceae bacterium]